MFLDRTQVALGSATYATCALSIVATVVSRPAPDRVILDCGSKTLTSDGARGFTLMPGFGGVFVDLQAADPHPGVTIERVSEEHAVCRVPDDLVLRIGDRVRVLPNHACTATNLSDRLWLEDAGGTLTEVPVAARGRIW